MVWLTKACRWQTFQDCISKHRFMSRPSLAPAPYQFRRLSHDCCRLHFPTRGFILICLAYSSTSSIKDRCQGLCKERLSILDLRSCYAPWRTTHSVAQHSLALVFTECSPHDGYASYCPSCCDRSTASQEAAQSSLQRLSCQDDTAPGLTDHNLYTTR
jgi:hypothetical protein